MRYEKYKRRHIHRILNWDTNPVAQNVGGYKVSEDKTNCPIFVTYEKKEDISDTTKYEDDSKIFFGNMRHWRSVNETLITFLTSKKMINKYLTELKLMSTIRHHPMELKLHEIYKKEYCISPIPSLAMHATNINSTYGLPPNFNWKKIWDENEVFDN